MSMNARRTTSNPQPPASSPSVSPAGFHLPVQYFNPYRAGAGGFTDAGLRSMAHRNAAVAAQAQPRMEAGAKVAAMNGVMLQQLVVAVPNASVTHDPGAGD